MTLTCPFCGGSNPDNALICQSCSVPLISIPCNNKDECDGTYEFCRGHLSTFVAGGYPGEPAYYTFCDRCDAEYDHQNAPSQCTRLICTKCRRPMP